MLRIPGLERYPSYLNLAGKPWVPSLNWSQFSLSVGSVNWWEFISCSRLMSLVEKSEPMMRFKLKRFARTTWTPLSESFRLSLLLLTRAILLQVHHGILPAKIRPEHIFFVGGLVWRNIANSAYVMTIEPTREGLCSLFTSSSTVDLELQKDAHRDLPPPLVF